jgi:tight adherence protein B
MRGIAVIAAAGSAWVLITGSAVRMPVRLPRIAALTFAIGAAAGVVATIAAYGLVGVPSVAMAIGALVSVVPPAVTGERRRAQRESIAAAWPDVLARMRSRLAGGSTLVEAFLASLDDAPSELAALAPAVDEAVRYGGGFVDALNEVRVTVADPIADRVAMTLAVANIAGGRTVGEVLAALSASVADELRLRRAHQAAMTEQRLTAVVALVAPWALLVLTLATNPQAAAAYATVTGTWIVLVGLGGTGLGYAISLRVARLSEPPRVFL